MLEAEQTFCFQFELEVDFNYPINQYASHPICDLRLVHHVICFWLIVDLNSQIMMHDVTSELGNILWVSNMSSITLFKGTSNQFLAPLLELLINQLHFIFILHHFLFSLYLLYLFIPKLLLLFLLLCFSLLLNFVDALLIAILDTRRICTGVI